MNWGLTAKRANKKISIIAYVIMTACAIGYSILSIIWLAKIYLPFVFNFWGTSFIQLLIFATALHLSLLILLLSTPIYDELYLYKPNFLINIALVIWISVNSAVVVHCYPGKWKEYVDLAQNSLLSDKKVAQKFIEYTNCAKDLDKSCWREAEQFVQTHVMNFSLYYCIFYPVLLGSIIVYLMNQ